MGALTYGVLRPFLGVSKTVFICSTFLKEVLRSSKFLLAAAISLELMSSMQPSFLTVEFWTWRARKSEVLLVQCFNMAEKSTHKQRERRSQQGGELPLFKESDPPRKLSQYLAPTKVRPYFIGGWPPPH